MYDGSAIVKMMMKMTVVGWDIGDYNDKDDGSLNHIFPGSDYDRLTMIMAKTTLRETKNSKLQVESNLG